MSTLIEKDAHKRQFFKFIEDVWYHGQKEKPECFEKLKENIHVVYPKKDFKPLDDLSENASLKEKEVHQGLNHLIHGDLELIPQPKGFWARVWQAVKLFFHVFFWPKPYFEKMAEHLCHRINMLSNSLPDVTGQQPRDEDQALVLQLRLNALLGLLPFCQPKDGLQLTLPCRDRNDLFRTGHYTLKEIPLTPQILGPRYVAYGLVPDDPTMPAHLLFRGTAPTGWRASWWGFVADLTPMQSVGSPLMAFGKKAIQQFIDEQHQKTGMRVQCHGQSLGGSMVMHTVAAFPEKTKGWANVPVGTRNPHNLPDTAQAHIITRGHDFAIRTGCLPRGKNIKYWHEYNPTLIDQRTASGDMIRGCHRNTDAFHKDTAFYEIDPDLIEQCSSHHFLTRLLSVVAWFAFPVLVALRTIIWPFWATHRVGLGICRGIKRQFGTDLKPSKGITSNPLLTLHPHSSPSSSHEQRSANLIATQDQSSKPLRKTETANSKKETKRTRCVIQ